MKGDIYLSKFHSGFVAVVGRPNVGKSTLLNRLVGHKVAIVSDKPQTTRNQIRCILTRPDAQVIFLDTPGVHRPKHRLGERMVKSAYNALSEVDLVAFLVDVASGIGPGDRYIAEALKGISTPILLIANKVDAADTGGSEFPESWRSEFPDLAVEDVFPVSALTGEGTDALIDAIVGRLPEGPKYYPDEWVTDHPERFVVAELIRERVLHQTREEIPHAVAVYVERMAPREDRDLIDIDATLYVERESQRGIVIGKNGATIRQVGLEARQEIEALLGSQVNLKLWVKVKRDWRNKEGALQELGYGEE